MKIKKILLILLVIMFCVINKSNCQVSAVQLHYPENIKIDQANGNLHIYAPAGLENPVVRIDVEMDSSGVDFLQITLTSAVILDRIAIYTCHQEKINGNYKYFYPNQAAIYFFPFSENEKSFILEMKMAEDEVLTRFDVNLKIDIRNKNKQDWKNLMLAEKN